MSDSTQDDGFADLKPKKQTVIQPLEPQTAAQSTQSSSNDDLLAELRAKTARLAAQVHGHDSPVQHILSLETEKDSATAAGPEQSPPASILPTQTNKTESKTTNPAVELVREKLARLYKKEPDAADESAEAIQTVGHQSKHQKFMYDLTTSGKSLADIQTEWHNYYVSLPDNEKHQVWQEFYENQAQISKFSQATQKTQSPRQRKPIPDTAATHTRRIPRAPIEPRSVGEIRSQILDKVTTNGRLTPVQHVKSLLFGLSMAALVGLIVTFTFFNEVFIAPFISPARAVSATPIVGNGVGDIGPDPKIIIPKINLEVPVVFDAGTITEADVQRSLEQGVVHYATTPNPGETGNVVIVGHSSNNILNKGKYKFAFVLLKRLEAEDTFFVQKDSKRYTYKVYRKEIVSPDKVEVLNTQDRPNTITLITCDPPGTSLNRLIITAEQIDPDPSGNVASTAPPVDTTQVNKLPSNAPSLWSRINPFD